ncbi:hypothetical protein U1Q18_021095 [Sarracenia purpurea var. burkii]
MHESLVLPLLRSLLVDNGVWLSVIPLPLFTYLFTEWHVLYTTQITQNAKKYHSGILRLASCGSYQMQVGSVNSTLPFLNLFVNHLCGLESGKNSTDSLEIFVIYLIHFLWRG